MTVQVTDPSWLSLRKGEFLVTDGVVKLCEPNGEMVMLVKNASGEHGCAYTLLPVPGFLLMSIWGVRCVSGRYRAALAASPRPRYLSYLDGLRKAYLFTSPYGIPISSPVVTRRTAGAPLLILIPSGLALILFSTACTYMHRLSQDVVILTSTETLPPAAV